MTPHEEAAALIGRIRGYKATIRQTRSKLVTAAARLAELEAECARLGIRLIVTTKGEEEGSSWPKQKDPYSN